MQQIITMWNIAADADKMFGVLQELGAEQDVVERRDRQRSAAGYGKVLSSAMTTLHGSPAKSAGHSDPTEKSPSLNATTVVNRGAQYTNRSRRRDRYRGHFGWRGGRGTWPAAASEATRLTKPSDARYLEDCASHAQPFAGRGTRRKSCRYDSQNHANGGQIQRQHHGPHSGNGDYIWASRAELDNRRRRRIT